MYSRRLFYRVLGRKDTLYLCKVLTYGQHKYKFFVNLLDITALQQYNKTVGISA